MSDDAHVHWTEVETVVPGPCPTRETSIVWTADPFSSSGARSSTDAALPTDQLTVGAEVEVALPSGAGAPSNPAAPGPAAPGPAAPAAVLQLTEGRFRHLEEGLRARGAENRGTRRDLADARRALREQAARVDRLEARLRALESRAAAEETAVPPEGGEPLTARVQALETWRRGIVAHCSENEANAWMLLQRVERLESSEEQPPTARFTSQGTAGTER
jgi:hypothetical protein